MTDLRNILTFKTARHVNWWNNTCLCVCVQGPLCDTVSDFWRMVWQYHCPAVVMMTKLEERNRVRPHAHTRTHTVWTTRYHTVAAQN